MSYLAKVVRNAFLATFCYRVSFYCLLWCIDLPLNTAASTAESMNGAAEQLISGKELIGKLSVTICGEIIFQAFLQLQQ